MQQLTHLIVLLYLIQIKWTIGRSLGAIRSDTKLLTQSRSSLDCSKYCEDHNILDSFPFPVQVNPSTPNSSKTYAKMDADDNVYYLNIVNEIYVPLSVFCLRHLGTFYVRNTDFFQFKLNNDSIRRLPAEIERLATSLADFRIYDSKITHLPDEIGHLKRLYRLEMVNTGLIDMPNTIGNLIRLRYLCLSNNNLTTLPMTMTNMKSLIVLNLNNNTRLRSLQMFNDLPFIFDIQAQNCLIERLPRNLPNLHSLDLSNNNLSNLVGIRTLGNGTMIYKVFNFSMNRIQNVPPQIQYVRNLRTLKLANNQLTYLPVDIFNIPKLAILDISKNLFPENELNTIMFIFNISHKNLILKYK